MLQHRRFEAVDAALAALALDHGGKHRTFIRVTRLDGSVAEGALLDAAVDGLTVASPNTLHGVEIRPGEIRSLEVRVPHRVREWSVAVLAVVAVTAVLVSVSQLRRTGEQNAADTFMLLYVAAAAVTPFVLARTGLGRWLQRWHALYSSGQ